MFCAIVNFYMYTCTMYIRTYCRLHVCVCITYVLLNDQITVLDILETVLQCCQVMSHDQSHDMSHDDRGVKTVTVDQVLLHL